VIPSRCWEVVDVDAPPAPGPGQVKVRVTTFPVHPGDLQAVAAARPTPSRPIIAGVEATGEVLEAGQGASP
jgi:NADPH:quinone reductase-like Zn-dependent oxidoreductase